MSNNFNSKKEEIKEKKFSYRPILTMFILFLSGIVNISFAQNQEYAENRLLIKFKAGVDITESELIKTTINARTVRKFNLIKAELWEFSGSSVDKVIADFKDYPAIEVIEPDYIIRLDDDGSGQGQFLDGKGEPSGNIPDDQYFGDLWGMHNTGQTGGTADADIDAPEAWDIETGNNVIVGIIDTGIDWEHDDLKDNMWTNPGEIPNNHYDDDGNGYVDDFYGYDFVNHDSEPMDDYGHGTHVAGTIAAKGFNEIGVVGVMWNARLMALKFIRDDGYGPTSAAIEAIEYAINMGVQITNNSWGDDTFNQLLYEVIVLAGAHGQLFVASAGNNWQNTDVDPYYPASYDLSNIISVAATNYDDGKWSLSNYGASSVDLGAPGVSIKSCIPDNSYDYKSGTSMAAPHVSGTAGLLVSANPGISMADVKARIMNSVDIIPSMQNITVSDGRLNAKEALIDNSSGSNDLIVSPGSYNFAVDMDASSSQELTIGVFGNQNMNWSITGEGSWLSVSPTSSTASPGNPSSVTLEVNTSGKPVGIYEKTLTITASTASQEQEGPGEPSESTIQVPVRLTVVSEQKFSGNSNDRFGFSTTADGVFVLAGSPYNNRYTGEVKAFIFDWNTLSWVENATLTASDGEYGDRFGFSVDMDDDYPHHRAIIGAYGDDEQYENTGSAYVFEYDGNNNTWNQLGNKLVPNDGATGDFFGWSVAIKGDYAYVGAPWDDDNETTSGSVYVFHWNGSNWNQDRKINRGAAAASGGKFGFSISIDKINHDYLFVGEPYGNGSHRNGCVLIYNTTTWAWPEILYPGYFVFDSGFGWSVDVHNYHAIIGAPFYGTTGAAYYSYKNLGNWTDSEIIPLSDGRDGDQFGWSVSILRGYYSYALVGSKWNDENGTDSGSAYMYSLDLNTHTLKEEYKLVGTGNSSNDWYGRSVSLCEPAVVYTIVGADGDQSNSGSIYISEVPFWNYSEEIKKFPSFMTENLSTEGAIKAIPLEYQLYQNYPNPFNPTTKIQYSLKTDVQVQLKIYNILGEEVRSLMNGFEEAGVKTVEWDGTNNNGRKVPSGIYIYNIKAGNFVKTRKMVLMK